MSPEPRRERSIESLTPKEESSRGSAGVIGCLREFNYGDRSMSARECVKYYISKMEGEPGETYKGKDTYEKMSDPQGFTEILEDKLIVEGLLKGESASWEETKSALEAALKDWESHDADWQKRMTEQHQDYRP